MSFAADASAMDHTLIPVHQRTQGTHGSRLRSVGAPMISRDYFDGPSCASHDTFWCQLTNVPVGLSFHAHTWSV